MALGLETFRSLYPEFDEAPDHMVSAHIAQAKGRVSADDWGSMTDEVVGLEAAQSLTMSPFGRALRQDGAATIYELRLADVRASAMPRLLVL